MNQVGWPNDTDVALVGCDTRAVAVDGMAGHAISCALEQGPASNRVADHQTQGGESVHVSKIRDDAGKFRGAECKGLHGRARDAVGDGQAQVIVRNDAFKLAGVKIDARNQVAILAVAGGALRSENLCAVLNVRLEILRSAVLPLSECDWPADCQEGTNDCALQYRA